MVVVAVVSQGDNVKGGGAEAAVDDGDSGVAATTVMPFSGLPFAFLFFFFSCW